MGSQVFLPSIKNEDVSSEHTADENLLFEAIRLSPHQKRTRMTRHPLLDRAARNKAEDIAQKGYFAHTSPDGVTANQNVRSVGYKLPDHYPIHANNIESLSMGGNRPQDNVQGWFDSPAHRPHVFGENNFFANHTNIGIGKSVSVKDGRNIYVFISAP